MPNENFSELPIRDLNLYEKRGFQLGDIQAYENVALVPLMGESSNLEYLVFEEALNNGLKVNETGNVPRLRMENKTNKDVLILQGEYITGGRQNRMIEKNVFMEKDFVGDIPVKCVEQGRWSYRSRRRPPTFDVPEIFDTPDIPREPVFRSSGLMATRKICASAHDQGSVWNNVSYLMAGLGVRSDTQNLGDTYSQRKRDIDDYLSHFDYVPGSLGIVVASQRNGTRTYGLDIFDQSKTMEKNFKKLLGSYILEAIASEDDNEINLTVRAVNDFLKQVSNCTYEEQPPISLGRDIKINNGAMEGSALIYENIPLYASVGTKSSDNRNPIRHNPLNSDGQRNFSTGFYRYR